MLREHVLEVRTALAGEQRGPRDRHAGAQLDVGEVLRRPRATRGDLDDALAELAQRCDERLELAQVGQA
ncbi:MAG: hypothetical protein E6G60_12140 [Actinobacteria bacterium]|nr:MAG: hypothetical protein E6G60_12140 [Actinomycetota bacterium]